MKSNEDMKEFILNTDREMCKKSFKYFFVDILGFMYNHHHQSWHDGLGRIAVLLRQGIS